MPSTCPAVVAYFASDIDLELVPPFRHLPFASYIAQLVNELAINGADPTKDFEELGLNPIFSDPDDWLGANCEIQDSSRWEKTLTDLEAFFNSCGKDSSWLEELDPMDSVFLSRYDEFRYSAVNQD